MFENVSISSLSIDYSTSIYKKSLEVMKFEVPGHKTSISNTNFCMLLGLTQVEGAVNPNLVVFTSIIRAYFQMGHKSDILFF